MSSFLTRLKSVSGPSSHASTPAKRDASGAEATPLQRHIADAEGTPVREDGSDKFFGMENFGSTCYCNSIVQCLYYSAPFRENVINFPSRSPPDSLNKTPPPPAPRLSTTPSNNGASLTRTNTATSPSTTASGAKNAGSTGQKPDDGKESAESKKKAAVQLGPVLTMDYDNAVAYGMDGGSLFTALKDIFEAVVAHKSRIGVVSPYKLLEILRRENEMFRAPVHQDAHEFLNLLLNQVVEAVERFSTSAAAARDEGATTMTNGHGNGNGGVDKIGWVHDLFEGMLTSETRCLTCENTSARDEAFLDLSVDLAQHSSVSSCLRKFSEEEMLCERNKFHCDNCGGLQEAEKRMKIKRLPRVLALHLKRFKYTEDLQRLQKLFHRVVYPYHLRLFNTTDDADDADRLYELYAVVVHIGGGPYHGHYVSIIKTQDRGWLLFDDEMVEPVDKSYVKHFFGGDGQLACAYVLFYQETTLEAMQQELAADALAAERKAAADAQPPPQPLAKQLNCNNGAMPNGHVVLHPATPTSEDGGADVFASLDRAATAPPTVSPFTTANAPTTTTMPAAAPPLDRFPTSPGVVSGALKSLVKKKSDVAFRKAEKEAEKARGAAEKAAGKERRLVEKENVLMKRRGESGMEKSGVETAAAERAPGNSPDHGPVVPAAEPAVVSGSVTRRSVAEMKSEQREAEKARRAAEKAAGKERMAAEKEGEREREALARSGREKGRLGKRMRKKSAAVVVVVEAERAEKDGGEGEGEGGAASSEPVVVAEAKEREGGGLIGGGLNRFARRHGSLALRSKPKLKPELSTDRGKSEASVVAAASALSPTSAQSPPPSQLLSPSTISSPGSDGVAVLSPPPPKAPTFAGAGGMPGGAPAVGLPEGGKEKEREKQREKEEERIRKEREREEKEREREEKKGRREERKIGRFGLGRKKSTAFG